MMAVDTTLSGAPIEVKPAAKRKFTRNRKGCITCRIRKIKCDETSPSCRKCLDTGRKCDGYTKPPPEPPATLIAPGTFGRNECERATFQFFQEVFAPSFVNYHSYEFWCDKTRPSCVNCITHWHQCPYQDEPHSRTAVLTPTMNSRDGSFGAQSTVSQSYSPSVQLNLPTPGFDLLYAKFLQQWLTETHRSYVFNDEHARIFGSATFNHALAFPFLMHGILANAALHLSLKHPEKTVFYRQHACELMNQALSEFTATLLKLDSNSIVAAFIFSGITSAHQMCQCFVSAGTDFNSFVGRFVECLRVSRGVNVVLRGWWKFIQETELKPILTVSHKLRAEMEIQRPEFDSVRHLIRSLEPMNSLGTTKSYLECIQSLQRLYNFQYALDSPELNRSTFWAFAWPINISSELTDLLEMRRPEAIVILAHYAPLLHCRRSSWAIGNAGAVMFQLVESFLGSKWTEWLRWPRETISMI